MLKKFNKNDVFKCVLFVLGFMVYLFIDLSNNTVLYDRLWTFHMTQKVSMGEIPYSEINIIITPLFYQLGALTFKIFGRADFMIYAIYNGLIGGLLTWLAYKVINEITKKEQLSFFASLFFLNLIATFAETSYNTLLLMFILLAIFLELKKEKAENKNKYNITLGVVLGLCAATKHTVGGIVLLASFVFTILKKYLFKEKCLKEITQKFIGVSIIGGAYLIWLICVGALYDFIDLAILGMFDFAEKNTVGTFFNFISMLNVITIFTAFLISYYIRKKEYLIMGIYAIVTLTFSIPIFNFYHNALTAIIPTIILMCLVIKIFEKSTKNSMLAIMLIYTAVKVIFMIEYSLIPGVNSLVGENGRWLFFENITSAISSVLIVFTVLLILFNRLKIAILVTLSILGTTICTRCYMWEMNVKENNLYYIPEYSVIGMKNEEMKDILEVKEYILEKEKEGYNVLILDIIASKYMIPMHRNNYKFDLMLNGNLGHNGEERLKEEIKSTKNLLILRQKPEIETIDIQQPEGIDKFIEENYKKIGEINNLEVFN